jgi:hypothetical protein
VATTRCGAMRNAGARNMRRRARRHLCRKSTRPGEAYQFDWSHEIVILDGVTTEVKVAHMRLCHSRMSFLRAYPREAQEMLFDAHDKAFAFYRGACERGIYDNMKTAVDAIFVGKERAFNRRFLQMMSHYLVEPTPCTPGAAWEKGQIENQVKNLRKDLFVPRPRYKSFEDLNAWLMDQCVAHSKKQPHPEFPDKTIFEVFEREREQLIEYRGPFDAYRSTPASVSKLCLVRFDNNKYSVMSTMVGRTVDVFAYADRIVIKHNGTVVGEHARRCATSRRGRHGPSCAVGSMQDEAGAAQRSAAAEGHRRTKPSMKPKQGAFIAIIDGILTEDKGRPKKQEHMAATVGNIGR